MLTPEQIESLPKEIKCVLQCAGRLSLSAEYVATSNLLELSDQIKTLAIVNENYRMAALECGTGRAT